ncbi:EF-hand 1, calcium-binding site-containing protein [Tanacetum coccineum]
MVSYSLILHLQELADHVVEVNLQHDVLDGMFTFFDSTVSTLQIYQVKLVPRLSNVAEELGVTVGLKHKKINVSNSRASKLMIIAWEHEHFSRLRVTAATLSGLSVPPDLLESTGGLFDNREFVNEAAVVKSVKVVAESLARHIHGQQGKNINIFADNSSLSVNPSYIRSWLDLMSRTPRAAPFLSKDNAFIMVLKKGLADHVVEVNLQHDVLDGMFTFYDATVSTLQIYQLVHAHEPIHALYIELEIELNY